MTHADEEFTSLRHPLLELDNIQLNVAATNEHVPEIERAIHTIKERNWSTVSGLPNKHYPMILKKGLVSHAVSWLNMFPHADGVSATMSPRTILTGITPNNAIQAYSVNMISDNSISVAHGEKSYTKEQWNNMRFQIGDSVSMGTS